MQFKYATLASVTRVKKNRVKQREKLWVPLVRSHQRDRRRRKIRSYLEEKVLFLISYIEVLYCLFKVPIGVCYAPCWWRE